MALSPARAALLLALLLASLAGLATACIGGDGGHVASSKMPSDLSDEGQCCLSILRGALSFFPFALFS
jgi:hypothetical protein